MEQKAEILKFLQSKGIDVLKLERELLAMLRGGISLVELQEYLKKVVERRGEKK